MNFTPSSRSGALIRSAAFTLIEMLIVITIISILFVVATPYTMGTMRSQRLTSAGDALLAKVSLAQQTAVSESRPIELRFYYYTHDGVSGAYACQLMKYNPVTNKSTPEEPATYFGEESVVMIDGALSPIFSGTLQSTDAGNADVEPFKSKGATFKRILFYPNGSTNISVPLRSAYVTLVGVEGNSIDPASPPPNFYTIQVDPITGRAKPYRPM